MTTPCMATLHKGSSNFLILHSNVEQTVIDNNKLIITFSQNLDEMRSVKDVFIKNGWEMETIICKKGESIIILNETSPFTSDDVKRLINADENIEDLIRIFNESKAIKENELMMILQIQF